MEILIESFKYGLAPAIVILIYLVAIKFFENRKDIKDIEMQKEQAKKTVLINNELVECITEIGTYLKHITKDILEYEDDKCTRAIHSSFKSLAYMLSKFATFTIISNNVIKNKENIVDNINSIVSSEFAEVYNHLLLFNTESKLVTSYINDKWKEQISNDLKSIIFDEHSTKEDRIYNIHNKLNLRINNYITSVTKRYVQD